MGFNTCLFALKFCTHDLLDIVNNFCYVKTNCDMGFKSRKPKEDPNNLFPSHRRGRGHKRVGTDRRGGY